MTKGVDKPRPIELCLERVGCTADDRYVRCTAQVGRAEGLALGVEGRILWCEQRGVGCEIWVSADQRLMAYCPAGMPTTTLYRAGRALALPSERPVVLRHRDELELCGARFRVHVHGVTDLAHAPTIVRTLARAAAVATLALGVGAAAGCNDSTSTQDAAVPDAAAQADAASVFILPVGPDAGPGGAAVDGAGLDAEEPDDAPIEVLESPPIVF